MNRELPGVILFDMDDTILADDGVSEKCWRQVCQWFAPSIERLEVDNLLNAIRETRRWYWSDLERNRRGSLDLRFARREIVSMAFARLGIDDEIARDELAESYTALRETSPAELIPGAIETLRSLRHHGVRLGLITNGSAKLQRAKIDRFKLESSFDSILIEGEFGAGKPEQRVFLHSLEQLNARPSEAWMIGDNLHLDVGGAQALGIYSVWVDWEGKGLPEDSSVQPDRIVRTITELVH